MTVSVVLHDSSDDSYHDATGDLTLGGGSPTGSAGGVLDGSYPNPGLAAGVAGAGLSEASDVLAVNVDGATIEINADALRVVPSTFQPLDSDLSSIAALSTTSYGRDFLTQANAAAALSYIGLGLVRRSADTAARNSGNTGNTLTNDDATGGTLAWSVAANDVWFFQAWLLMNSANTTMGSKFGWSVPSGCTMSWGLGSAGNNSGSSGFGAWSSTNPGPLKTESGSQNVNSGTTLSYGVPLAGMVVNGANAGTVTLQWAQNTSNGSDLKLLANSVILLWKLA